MVVVPEALAWAEVVGVTSNYPAGCACVVTLLRMTSSYKPPSNFLEGAHNMHTTPILRIPSLFVFVFRSALSPIWVDAVRNIRSRSRAGTGPPPTHPGGRHHTLRKSSIYERLRSICTLGKC